MGDVVVVVVIVVLLVLGAALVARVTGRGRPEAGGAALGGGDSADSASTRGAAGGTAEQPRVDGPPAFGPPPQPADSVVAEGPAGGVDGGPPPAAGPPVPADRVIGPAVRRSETGPATPLPELLAGVRWPCGLQPVTGPDDPDRDRYVAAMTTAGVEPDDVGSAMADELERLGYRLHSLSEEEAVARRGDELLSLRLHPDAADAELAGRPLFPGAGAGTVGIELWSGAGPNPRTT